MIPLILNYNSHINTNLDFIGSFKITNVENAPPPKKKTVTYFKSASLFYEF